MRRADQPDIVAFIRDRYDEREQAALAVKSVRKPWYFELVDDAAQPFVEMTLAPDAVLADLAAKRQILAEHAPEAAGVRTVCAVCADPPVYEATWRSWPCRTVRLLAAPFDAHPDYREKWKP